MSLVKVGLEIFGQHVARIVGAGDSPYAHAVFNVVLSDCTMSCVDCPGVFVHCGLCCDVFGSLV